MVDAVDLAQQREEEMRAAALARRPAAKEEEARPAPRDCRDCGAPIPRKRLKAMPGAERCVQCQAAAEGGAD